MALRTSLVAQPHLYIGDVTGKPLDYGIVYFGQPNKDPEFYPIDIYYDESLTVAAAQPVRTKGGFLNANGDMIEVYANELTYSVKVLDGYGIQVFYKPEMTRTNTDNLLTVKLPFASAKERSQNEKNQEFLSIDDFDDLPDYTLAMQAWESELSGKTVDLKGKTLVSNYIPKTIQFINGAIENGGRIITQPLEARAHPISGNMGVILDDGVTHFWCHEMLHSTATGKTMLFVKHAYRHAASLTAPLYMYVSEDKGLSFKSTKIIYNRRNYDIAEVRGEIMQGGRIGLFLTVRDASSAYTNDFIYSDNNGLTWTVLTNVCSGHFSYSDVLQSPFNASTYYVYGYIGGNLQIAKTINNGLNWTNTTVTLTGVGVSEPSVVKLPNQNKWLMFIRTTTDMFISTSTDMESWTAPVNSGLLLGNNPVQAFIENGKLFVYLFIRDMQETLGKQNDCLLLIDDYDYVYNNKSFSNKNLNPAFTGIDRSLGYIRVRKTNMGNIFTLNAAEYDGSTNASSSSSVLIGGNYLNYVPTPKVAKPNFLRNGKFDFWSRGNTFTGSENFKCCDSWWVNTSGSTVTASKYTVPNDISQSLPFRPKYGLKLVATPEDYVGLLQYDYSDSALQSTQSQILTVQIWGVGDIPELEAGFMQYFGATGSPLVQNAGYKFELSNTGLDKMWSGVARIPVPSIGGKDVQDGSYFRLALQSRINAAWDCVILGVNAVKSTHITPYVSTDYNRVAEADRCKYYLEVLNLKSNEAVSSGFSRTETSIETLLHYSAKMRTPTITVTGAFTFYPSLKAVTDIAASTPSKKSSILTGTGAAGGVAGQAGFLRCASGGTAQIIIDCE